MLVHHRRSIRLKGYDYSQAGAYFVTICVHERKCLFGEIVELVGEHQGECRKPGEYPKAGECHSPLLEMVLNEFGLVVQDEWVRSAEIRAEIELGVYVVMPLSAMMQISTVLPNMLHPQRWIEDKLHPDNIVVSDGK